jgi:hypothetical protein
MTRQSEHDANRRLSDSRWEDGWLIPTTKPTWRVSVRTAAIVAGCLVAASVLGQWMVIS